LAQRIRQQGRRVECIDAGLAERIGSKESRSLACEFLARNGVVVVTSTPDVRPDGDRLDIYLTPSDDHDRAAEGALRAVMARLSSRPVATAFRPATSGPHWAIGAAE
jgi:hypothetical protein